jgi:EpsI family protein
MRKRTLLGLVAAAFVVCYAAVIWTIVETWTTSYVYSYGFLVFLVCLYVLWSQLPVLQSSRRTPDYLLGIPIIVAGVSMLAAGRLSLIASVQEASLVVTLAGLILVFVGRQVFTAVSFPLFYLLLGIPIWDRVIARLQPPSQLLSARMASGLLEGIGVPVLRQGTHLLLPNVVLDVMRECSGVNQLLAIVSLALPAAYLTLKSTGRRVGFLGFAIVDAYLSNGVRIALVGLLAYRGLSDGDLRGVHLLEGLAVSVVGYVCLFGILAFLAKGDRNGRTNAEDVLAYDAPSVGTESPVDQPRRLVLLDGALIFFVFAAGVWLVSFRPEAVPLRTDLRTFPRTVEEWTVDATHEPLPVHFPAIDDELVHAYPSPSGARYLGKMDDELVRVYRNSSNQSLSLYIGYDQSQREGKELISEVGHLLDSAAITIKVPFESDAVEVGEIRQESSRGSRGLLYWYDVDGHAFKSIYLTKKYLALNALTRRRTNGAVIMVGWESRIPKDGDVPRLAAIDFVRTVLGLIPRFIPS